MDLPDDAPSDVYLAHDALTDRLGARWSRATEVLGELDPKTPAGLVAKAQATILAFERDMRVMLGETVDSRAQHHEWAAYRLALSVLELAGVERWPLHPGTVEFRRRHGAVA